MSERSTAIPDKICRHARTPLRDKVAANHLRAYTHAAILGADG